MRYLTPQEENLVNGGVLRFLRLILRPTTMGDATCAGHGLPLGCSDGPPAGPLPPMPDLGDPPHMKP